MEVGWRFGAGCTGTYLEFTEDDLITLMGNGM